MMITYERATELMNKPHAVMIDYCGGQHDVPATIYRAVCFDFRNYINEHTLLGVLIDGELHMRSFDASQISEAA